MALLDVAQAQRRITELAPRLEREVVHLRSAAGRVLANDVTASRALPGFDNSAMDGYAVQAADVPATLPVTGVIAAGADVHELTPLLPGTAVQIFTGAPMPPGADAIVIVEDVIRDGANVTLPAATSGDHVRRTGEDTAIGQIAVVAGLRLRPGAIAMLAAQGCSNITVHCRPRVAILATGDELVDVDTALQSGQVVDSSAHMLAAQIVEAGGEPHYLGVVADEPSAVLDALQRALQFDVVLTTGGVSAGERDYVRPALAAAGIELEFWKVAMKPGKPFAFGQRQAAAPSGKRTTMVFALPGNPVSSFVAFELFVRPALLAMQGGRNLYRTSVPVVLVDGYRKPAGRAHYLRATLVRHGTTLHAVIHPKQGSAMLSSVVECDALVEIPTDAEMLAPGSVVTAMLI